MKLTLAVVAVAVAGLGAAKDVLEQRWYPGWNSTT
jgi:hypothetical protein